VNPFIIEKAVNELLEKFPFLTVDGLQPDRYERTRKPVQSILIDAVHNREQIDHCLAWLELCSRTRGFNRQHDTYRFKHEVERHVGEWVSHSSMLIAAQIAKLEMRHANERPWAAELKLGAKRPGQW